MFINGLQRVILVLDRTHVAELGLGERPGDDVVDIDRQRVRRDVERAHLYLMRLQQAASRVKIKALNYIGTI